jgi:hypothetical protein
MDRGYIDFERLYVFTLSSAFFVAPRKRFKFLTNIAAFSLATKTSWKNDAGSWESRTEWHRCVAFGKLAAFAGTLTKGAHVAIEGEHRSHKYQRELSVGKDHPHPASQENPRRLRLEA